MAQRRDLIDLMEDFKSTRIWKEILKHLDEAVERRKNVLAWLTGEMGLDFDLKYSAHDLMRADIRFIELMMKKIPDNIIEEENNRIINEEAMKASEIQENVDALADMQL